MKKISFSWITGISSISTAVIFYIIEKNSYSLLQYNLETYPYVLYPLVIAPLLFGIGVIAYFLHFIIAEIKTKKVEIVIVAITFLVIAIASAYLINAAPRAFALTQGLRTIQQSNINIFTTEERIFASRIFRPPYRTYLDYDIIPYTTIDGKRFRLTLDNYKYLDGICDLPELTHRWAFQCDNATFSITYFEIREGIVEIKKVN